MSSTIDERVVEMRFDNKDFEKNVNQSMSTLEKLKEKLNFTGASKGLEEVNKAAKKTDMSGISTAVETVNAKFSALQVMGVTALANITNSAVNAGKRITKALTIDPIKTGFQEYETQINAVQTILSNTRSKGTTIDDVNKALDTLNTYADKTIYNFTEMTRNIGTFTAAGIDLDTSVNAIQGIANLAAVSGSTSQQASTAMYQLSQALSSGTVKLMDWNSVVNAGMGGQVFQDALKETARVHGVNIDKMIEKNGSFRETLQEGWLSSEILTETLQKFTMTTEGLTDAQIAQNRAMLKAKGYTDDQVDAIFALGEDATNAATKVKTFTQLIDTFKESVQSGWTQTWEILIGDFEEAKELFTGISDALGELVGKMNDRRNAKLEKAMNGPIMAWEKLAEKVNKAGIKTDDFQKALKQTAKKHGVNVDKMIKKEGSFEKTLQNGWLTKKILVQTLEGYTEGLKDSGKSTDDMTKKLKEFQRVVDDVWRGSYGNGKERIEALTKAGYKYSEVQELVNKTINGQKLKLEDLSNAQLKSVGYTDKEIKALRDLEEQARKSGGSIEELLNEMSKSSGRDLLIDSFENIYEAIKKIATAIGDAWKTVFPDSTDADKSAEGIYDVVKSFNDLTEAMIITDEQAESVKNIGVGIFSAWKLTWGVLASGLVTTLRIIDAVLGLLGEDLLSIGDKIATVITKISEWMDKNRFAQNFLTNISTLIVKVIEGVEKCIDAFFGLQVVKDFLKGIGEIVGKFLGKLDLNGVSGLVEGITKTVENLFNIFEKCIKNLEGNSTFKKILQQITNFVSKVFETMPMALDAIVDGVEWLIELLKKPIEYFKSMKFDTTQLTENFKNMTTMIKQIVDKILSNNMFDVGKDIVNGLIAGIKDGIPEIFNVVVEMATTIIEAFCNLLGINSPSKVFIALGGFLVAGLMIGISDKTSEVLNAIKGFAGTIIDAITGILQNGLPYIVDLVSAIANNIKTGFQEGDFDIGSIAVFASLIGIFFIMKKLVDVAEKFANPFDKLGGFFGQLKSAVEAVKDSIVGFMKAKKMAAYADAIKNIAIAVGILAASLYLISNIETDKLLRSGLVLAALCGALVLMAKLTQNANPVAFGKLSVMMLALALSLNIMTKAVDRLASIEDPDALNKAVVAIVNLMMGMTVLVTTYGALVKGDVSANIKKVGLMLMKMATAILIMTFVIKMLSSMEQSEIDQGMSNIAGIMVLFGLFMTASKFAGQNAVKAGVLLLTMAVAIGSLIGVIKLVSMMDPGEITKGMLFLGGVMLMFAGVVAVSKFAGQHAAKAGRMLFMMSAAIGIMALSVKLLAGMSVGEITAGMMVISSIMKMFAVFMGLSLFVGNNAGKAGVMLLGMAAAIGIMSLSLKLLATINDTDISRGFTIITGMSVLFGAFIALSQFAGKHAAGAGKMIFQMSLAMLILTASIAILSVLKEEDVWTAVGAVSAVMVLFGGLVAVSKLASDNTKSLTMLVVSFGAIAASIAILSALKPEKIMNASKCLSMVIGMFALLVASSKLATGSIGTLVVMTVALAAIGGILYLLSGMNVEGTFTVAASLSMLLLSLSATFILLGAFSSVLPAAMSGVVMFGILVAELAIVLAALGALSKIPGLNEIIADGGEFLRIVGNALGQFVGGLAGGIAEGFTSSLPQIGSDLSGFMKNAAPFIEGARTIDASMLEGVKSLIKMILMLTAADFISSITAWITGGSSLTDFATQLVPFGESMKKYSEAVKGIDAKAVTASATAGKSLAELVKAIPNTGGLAGLLAGDNNLSDLTVDLIPFGENMTKFSKAVSGMDSGAVKKAAKSASALADMMNDIADARTSNVLSFSNAIVRLGETDLKSFIAVFTNADAKLNSAARSMIDNLIEGIESKKGEMANVGRGLIEKFLNAIKNSGKNAKTAITSLMNVITTAIETFEDDFESSGNDLGDGLVNGIKAKYNDAYNAGYTLGQKAVQGEKDGQQSNSPSKLTFKAGKWIGEGLVNGITYMGKKVYNAGYNMGDTAANSMTEAIRSISSVLDSDMDVQPTIRPVVDLSDVRTGAGAINNLLGMGTSIGVNSNIGAINATMNRRNQNGMAGEVVSAINKLRKDIGNINNTSYNINGITYDDGSNIASAVDTLVRAAVVGRRV